MSITDDETEQERFERLVAQDVLYERIEAERRKREKARFLNERSFAERAIYWVLVVFCFLMGAVFLTAFVTLAIVVWRSPPWS